MIEKSHEQKLWYDNEGMVNLPSGSWAVKLLVRWNELVQTISDEFGERTEYQYSAHRILYELPDSAPHDLVELPIFLDEIKDVIIAAAQNRLVQYEGFYDF